MGKRGPAAKPTLRILHGDRFDRINDHESVPPAQEIACPDWASGGVRAARFGLTPSDRPSIKVEVGHGDQGQGAGRLLS